jgi:S1-C subfamily serine protease
MYEPGGYGYGYGYGEQPPPPPPRRGPGVLSYVAVAVAAGALGAGAVLAFGHVGSGTTAASSPAAAAPSNSGIAAAPPGSQQQSPAAGGVPGSGSSANIQSVYDKVEPGLVIINISQGYNSVQAAGTGMVLTSNGEVLTNNHVIESSTSVSATIPATGRTYQAKVLGYDKTGDIALIQLQGASGLRTIPVGDSGTVRNGAAVVAMGNAEGRNEIVPAGGHVTGINQTVTAQDQAASQAETLHGMIETDAAIVSGDSGGALANAAGQVIGMNTAGNNGGSNGFGFGNGSQADGSAGFAIPINTALSVVHQIQAGTASSAVSIGYPPFLGIFISDSASSNPQTQAGQLAQGSFGSGSGQACIQNSNQIAQLSTIAQVSSGTLVEAVICGQPAAAVGMTAGSVITAVNGQAVGSPASLSTIVSRYQVGSTVSVTWVSPSGKTTTSDMKLIPGPPH